jgi:hypothetical protein
MVPRVTARAINAAAFAPRCLSEGKPKARRFHEREHREALRRVPRFQVGKGVLGTIDLSRVLHTSGRGRRTHQFTEMTGRATYDRGAVALRASTSTPGLTAAATRTSRRARLRAHRRRHPHHGAAFARYS